ncbi:SAP30-binding protein [Etheostoma spectabile]|uniref:SAP30-binding protein n=1 Tax=Etheostoma spectabile TaxID=54343 RepID=UPI0013AEB5B5|nr:SAP30-binding protein [Etheostoma spectabile]
MASGKKSVLLSSLADYGDDSEPDSDSEPEETGGRVAGLVYSYGEDDLNRTEGPNDKVSGDEGSRDSNSEMEESDEGRDADDVEVFKHPHIVFSEVEKKDPNELVALFSEKVRNMSPDEIRIPPEPPGCCSIQLQEKTKSCRGEAPWHFTKHPSKKKRRDSFFTLVCLGTQKKPCMRLVLPAKAQKVEMDKLEKAKKERTKIEFVTGTKKGTNPSSTASSTSSNTTTTTATAEAQKRKSKWDSAIPVTLAQPTLITTSATLPAVVSVTTTASGTKTTVISAVGTILKKSKQ